MLLPLNHSKSTVTKNILLYYIVGATCGRPSIHSKLKTGEHSSPLRYDIEFNLIAAVNNYVFVSFLGGSKPPPYHVVVYAVSFATAFGCFSLTMQLLLFRKNHARLACSVVNALATARCRYRLLRILDNRIFRLPLTGNICDRRLWRIKGASVGVAADFVRRSKPHKQNRDTARGQ